MTIETQELQYIPLSAKIADSTDVVNALDSLDNRLSNLVVGDNISTIHDIVDVVGTIVSSFGGTYQPS